MTGLAVSAPACARDGSSSLCHLMVSDDLPGLIKSARFRRFLLGLLLLILFVPSPASAATACAAGERLYQGSCYSCSGGFQHDVAYAPSDGRSCFSTTDATFKNNYYCASGEHQVGSSCYDCNTGNNTGYSYQVFTPTKCEKCLSTAFGICTNLSVINAKHIKDIGCHNGAFDGLNSKCYTCPAGTGQYGIRQCRGRKAATLVQPKSALQACVGLGEGNCATHLRCVANECRHDPGQSGEICGIGNGCDSSLACISGRCKARKAALESCASTDQCQSNLRCVAGECRHDPGQSGEICGLGNGCDSNLACFGDRCITPRQSKQSCSGLGQGNCATDLRCVAGECRSDPGQAGEICGLGNGCDTNLVCNAQRCVAPRTSTQSCEGSGQGTCATNLRCVAGECRSDPGQAGEICGLGNGCDSNLACFGDRCIAPRQSTQSCSGLGQGNCATDLRCVAGECRSDPGQAGEICGLGNGCDTNLVCNAQRCVAPRTSTQSCEGSGQGTCATNLRCVAGECRSDPGQAGEICGLGNGCDSNLACFGDRCIAPRQSTQSCTGLGQGNCADDLRCVAGECRSDPGQAGEICGLGNGCDASLVCFGDRCVTPRQSTQSCTGLGQGNCADDLRCVAGECRSDPGQTGEICGLGNDCASNLVCNLARCSLPRTSTQSCEGLGQGTCATDLRCVANECRSDPGQENEICGIGNDCRDGLVCNLARCSLPRKAGQSCEGFFQGTCEDNLICDGGSHKCRHDPPILGEACGIGVSCSIENKDFNDEDDQANGTLECFRGKCAEAGGPGEPCEGGTIIDPQGTCADDMVCGIDGFCGHVPRLAGERCDPVFQPCSASFHPHDREPVTNEVIKQDLSCHSKGFGQPFLCDRPRETGEICSGLGQGSCRVGNLCALTYDDTQAEVIALRCVPKLDAIFGNNGAAQCKAFYSKITAANVNNSETRRALTFGYATDVGSGVVGSIETGVVYGPPVDKNGDPLRNDDDGTIRDRNGEFGCYQTICLGVAYSVGVAESACVGWDLKFPDNPETTYEIFGEVDIAGLITAGASPVDAGVSYSQAFEFQDSGVSFGGAACLFLGLGIGDSPVTGGAVNCTTHVLPVSIDDLWPAGSNGGQTGGLGQPGAIDEDGDGDVAGAGCGVDTTVSIRPKSGKLQLTWPPYAGAESYVIRRSSEGADSGYETVVDAHMTTYATYLDEGLTNGNTYWYRVAPQDSLDVELCTTAPQGGVPVARSRTR